VLGVRVPPGLPKNISRVLSEGRRELNE